MRAKLARNCSVVILIQRPMIKAESRRFPQDSLSLDTLQWAFGNPRLNLSVLAFSLISHNKTQTPHEAINLYPCRANVFLI
jgi:hypothetical protein